MANTNRLRNAATGSRWLLLLLGGGGIAGCSSSSSSWSNTRSIYLRNQTAAELRLTWKIPRASFQPGAPEQWPREVGAALIEPGGLPPRIICSLVDTVLDNYQQPLPVQSHSVAGDSLALTVRLAPGARYLHSSFAESFHHSDPDQHSVGGCTFLPCTLQWRSADGHLHHQVLQPLTWRSAQDQEADRQLTKSYDLVRYIEVK